jgi:pimeloyl-ACP methyl ester carboxylesterase
MQTRTRQVGGLIIRYADSAEGDGGAGPVIVATSPWPESLLAFRRIWPILAGQARVVAIDLPGFGHSEGRTDLFTPEAMAEFLRELIGEFGLGPPHLFAPDVGTDAALFLAARHPGAVRSLVVGGGAAAFPLEVADTLADIIGAPDIEAFRDQDIRATVVEPVAHRDHEPDVWEDYVSSYEDGRFAESTRYVRSYPLQLRLMERLLPDVRVPVHIVYGANDSLVPPSNGHYLAQQLPNGQLTILDVGHFGWEEDPERYAAIISDTVARAEAAPQEPGRGRDWPGPVFRDPLD